LRTKSEQVVASLKKGNKIKLTYRGKEIAYLSPIENKKINWQDDVFFTLPSLATDLGTITNKEIDQLIYG
jgi:antitoxin (DNA-binding transcriptional repressor) of toxin-antitoxin stability system